MSKEIVNSVRQAAQQALQGQAQTRLGTVTGFDPSTYSAKVQLQPEGLETGWLPVTSAWTGNGWGIFCPPTPGDLVQVEFQEGGTEAGFIVGRFYNDVERPLPTPSGEIWIQHKLGGYFRLLNTGVVVFTDAHGASLQMNGDGSITSAATVWNHTGPVNITGNVAITGTELVTGKITGQGGMAISGGSGATVAGNVAVTGGNVTADGIGLKTHTHPDPQGGTTGTPQ